MKKKYIFQPKNGHLLEEITDQIKADDYSKYKHLRVLVAYAKLSGVELLAKHLKNFRAAGGKVDVIVGIGQKNTSKEAVERLMELSDSCSIFHNPASLHRTFHPKAYLLSAGTTAWASVGSSNLTKGGLLTNYEANEIADYDLAKGGDKDTWKALKALFDEFSPAKNKSSLEATETLVQQLNEKGVLPSEQAIRQGIRSASKAENQTGLGEIFGTDDIPEPPSKTKTLNKNQTQRALAAPGMHGFWKKLSDWDVSKSSSPGQIQIPKQFGSCFPTLGAPVFTESGAEQSDTYFNVLFVDSNGKATLVENARLILYVPAATHARPNEEYRFTFRHRPGVFDVLSKNDVLEFTLSDNPDYWFVVRQYKAGSAEANSRTKNFASF